MRSNKGMRSQKMGLYHRPPITAIAFSSLPGALPKAEVFLEKNGTCFPVTHPLENQQGEIKKC